MKNIAWPNPSIFNTAKVQQHTAKVSTSSESMPPPPRPSARINPIPEQRNRTYHTESPSPASDNNSLSNVRNAPRIVPAAEMPQPNTNDDSIAGFRRDFKPFSAFSYEVNHASGLRTILDERRRAAGFPPAIPGERGMSILGGPVGEGGMTQMTVPPSVLSNAGPSPSASSPMPAIRGNAATVPSMSTSMSPMTEENQYEAISGNSLRDQGMVQSPMPLTTPTMANLFPLPLSSMLSYPRQDPMLPSMPASPSSYPISAKRPMSSSFSGEQPSKVNKTDHTDDYTEL